MVIRKNDDTICSSSLASGMPYGMPTPGLWNTNTMHSLTPSNIVYVPYNPMMGLRMGTFPGYPSLGMNTPMFGLTYPLALVSWPPVPPGTNVTLIETNANSPLSSPLTLDDNSVMED